MYSKDAGKGSGLAMIPKLKYEHIHLNSFSKMRVDLATQVYTSHTYMYYVMLYFKQVLSESVAKALPLVVGEKASETARFAEMFDKFFDALNVSNFSSGIRHRKPFQKPYLGSDDERIQVSW